MTLVNTDFFFKNAVTRHSNNRSELYGIARSIMAGSKRQLLEMMKNKKDYYVNLIQFTIPTSTMKGR